MADYTLVPVCQRATIEDYLSLFRHTFGNEEKFNEHYLRWQYLQNPHGAVIGFDAYHGSELAAHYAVIPRSYQQGAQKFTAALSLNTATHPDHQGKGLFVSLASATYEAAAKSGIQFVLGVANANSVPGFVRRLGFFEVGQVNLRLNWRAPLRAESALDISLQEEWLTWRFSNPSRRYEKVSHDDGTSTIRTWVKHVPFNVCRVPTEMLVGIKTLTPSKSTVCPALSPFFGPDSPSGLVLPKSFQPSPWHVIWKPLTPAFENAQIGQLRFDGLSMDTF